MKDKFDFISGEVKISKLPEIPLDFYYAINNKMVYDNFANKYTDADIDTYKESPPAKIDENIYINNLKNMGALDKDSAVPMSEFNDDDYKVYYQLVNSCKVKSIIYNGLVYIYA